MKFSIITANKNGGRFLEECIRSVLAQRLDSVEIEYILIDGGSTDPSPEIIQRYSDQISIHISEKDSGPASAINKGLRLATGDIVAWLNADDRYHPGALRRVAEVMDNHPDCALSFGGCWIIDEGEQEIRKGITRFKEAFFPLSSHFTIQCLNYISQPTLFFRRSACEAVGYLREDLVAAWDYEFLLRLWRCGGAVRVPGPPLADFRWHTASISGQRFMIQFREEYEAASRDAGPFAPQTWIHWFVRWGIVGAYRLMAAFR